MLFVFFFDIVGTAAFAISGAFVGIRNRLDLFGIFVLAAITASGGGLIRDIFFGNGLPGLFTNPKYLATIVISMILACTAYKYLSKIYLLIQIFDAIGLGVFTVYAAYKAILLDFPLIGVVFVAVITGIGGGIMRDVLVRDVPLVLKSEIYALASISGAVSFYYLYSFIGTEVSIYLGIFIVFIIRLLAIYYKLNLPVLKVGE